VTSFGTLDGRKLVPGLKDGGIVSLHERTSSSSSAATDKSSREGKAKALAEYKSLPILPHSLANRAELKKKSNLGS
jgi:hypothetical protein